MTGKTLSQKRLSIALLLLFTSLAFAIAPAAAQQLPVAEVQMQTFPLEYEFDARIEAVNEATVASRIAAEVVELNFDVDDRVPQDAVILRFRDEEFKARLEQAQAALLAERAQYQEALARQEEASAEAKRISDLFDRRQVTRSALDKASADRAAADARVRVLAAQIKVRQAQVEEAKVQLSYTTVRAPYGGVVTERHIELGEMASPGQLLMSGLSLDQLRAVANVPQRLVAEVSAADAARVQKPDSSWLAGGKITLVPQADPASHSFDVRVDLPQNIAGLYPGSMVKLRFSKGEESVPVIPARAVVRRSEVSGVYIVDAGRVMFRQIRPGRALAPDWLEVLAGVAVGEQVVTDPKQAVQQLKASRDE